MVDMIVLTVGQTVGVVEQHHSADPVGHDSDADVFPDCLDIVDDVLYSTGVTDAIVVARSAIGRDPVVDNRLNAAVDTMNNDRAASQGTLLLKML